MKMIGLFRDVDPHSVSPVAPSITAAVDGLTAEAAGVIAEYLEKTEFLVLCVMGYVRDPLDRWGDVQLSICSDGPWVWQFGLAYLVRKYRILLPDEFLLYVLKQEFLSNEGVVVDHFTLNEKISWMEKNPSSDFRVPTVYNEFLRNDCHVLGGVR